MKRTLLLVPAWPGQPRVEDLAAAVLAGQRPRTDYVELAHVLDADVVDAAYMQTRATRTARVVARAFGLVPGQVVEGFLRRGQYASLVARADRLGLPLALLLKVSASGQSVVLVSAWLSRFKKAIFLSHLKVHTHLSALINYSSRQAEIAVTRLGVPAEKVHVQLQPVDEAFWRDESARPAERTICAVGVEQRDYPTLLSAVRGLDVRLELAVGTTVWVPTLDGRNAFVTGVVDRTEASGLLTEGVRLREQLDAVELRELYARSAFVVVPLVEAEFDAGVTVICEAMSMGKAVIVTRTEGQRDVVRHGETGLYVPPGDAHALRDAIARLLQDPQEARRMGEAGRRLVEEAHRLDQWVAGVVAVVQRQVELPR